MRRKPNVLIPIEIAILDTALALHRRGEHEFHGFAMARRLREREEARDLLAHGTLYKALDRMRRAGLLAARWEDPNVAEAEGRPRRRLYQVTVPGSAALAAVKRERAREQRALRRRLAES